MHTYTNLAWPDDPYRTGQQLYRGLSHGSPPSLWAASGDTSHPTPAAAAIVYLPLHRTHDAGHNRADIDLRVSRSRRRTCAAEHRSWLAVADVDLLQACRHAAVLAGDRLASRPSPPPEAHSSHGVTRGLAAVEGVWAERTLTVVARQQ